jgi:DNA polymerase III epsilon subunit-like protein
MQAFADFMGELNDYGKPKWQRLDVAAARFGIPPGGHRALGDAETCRKVVLSMATETT